jgi:hypothetical protein
MEIWKDIPGYEGIYQVSNLGKIKSIPRVTNNTKGCYITKELILKHSLCKSRGYPVVRVSIKSVRKTIVIHQAVAMAFLNHTPCGHKIVVDHINEDKTDNRVENLQVITNRENCSKSRLGKGSSKYTGVSWSKSNKKWISQICVNGKREKLGYFNCELEASISYQNKLKEIL